jgi:hypothetical protein
MKIETWVAMCVRKRRYGTERQADRTAKRYGQRVYYCRNCLGFHLTKTELRNVK